MPLKQRCFLIHGEDTFRSKQKLQAIESRFLKQAGGFCDLLKYDLEDTPIDTIRQTFLATPFLVSHRLFILKNAAQASKATTDTLKQLLGTMSQSTIVVLYEARACSEKSPFYKWLVQEEATIDAFPTPSRNELTQRITTQLGSTTIDKLATNLLIEQFGADTWRLHRELTKLAAYSQAHQRTQLTVDDISALCAISQEDTVFQLTDALRDGNIQRAIAIYHSLREREDPFMIAGAIAAQIRNLGKIFLCYNQGITQAPAIAAKCKINPYVVKLSLPLARNLTRDSLKRSYRALVWFDEMSKSGRVDPSLGILLLILRLHGTLKVGVRPH